MYDPAHLSKSERDEQSDALPSHLNRLTQTPLLSPEEERVLARRAKSGDPSAKQRLVEANMRLVINIARNYRSWSVPFEDLIQEGALGLMDAVDRFDPDRGFRFSTYATHWIRQTIGRALDSKAKAIRLPSHVSEMIRKAERERGQFFAQTGRDPSANELAEAIGVTPQRLLTILQWSQEPVSIDLLVGDDGVELGSLIADKTVCNPEEAAINRESLRHLNSILLELSERERRVVRRRLGLEEFQLESPVLREISSDMLLSRERVRQIELQALRKLRAIVRRRKLPSGEDPPLRP